MALTKSRITGSNFTVFNYNGNALAWLDQVTDSGQMPLSTSGHGFEVITPLGSTYPKDLATTRVRTAGTLTATVRELWTAPAWQQFEGLAGTATIITVWQRMSQSGYVTCNMIIKTPGSSSARGWTYHTCSVIGITPGETIKLGNLTMTRRIQIIYFLRTPLSANTTVIW